MCPLTLVSPDVYFFAHVRNCNFADYCSSSCFFVRFNISFFLRSFFDFEHAWTVPNHPRLLGYVSMEGFWIWRITLWQTGLNFPEDLAQVVLQHRNGWREHLDVRGRQKFVDVLSTF